MLVNGCQLHFANYFYDLISLCISIAFICVEFLHQRQQVVHVQLNIQVSVFRLSTLFQHSMGFSSHI